VVLKRPLKDSPCSTEWIDESYKSLGCSGRRCGLVFKETTAIDIKNIGELIWYRNIISPL